MDGGFTDYADKLALNSAKKYNNYVDNFYLHTIQNDEKKLKLQNKINNLNVSVRSPFLINEDDVQAVKNKVKSSLSSGSILFTTGGGLKVIEPQINNYLSNPLNANRLKNIETTLSSESLKADDSPEVEVLINSGLYDLLPTVFKTGNTELAVELDRGVLKVTNNTNNFIDIEAFTIYWGDKVDTLEKLDLSIPPQATSKKKVSGSFDVYKSPVNSGNQNPRYVSLNNSKGTFHFGVALSYFNVDTNVRNTLLERETYSRSDF